MFEGTIVEGKDLIELEANFIRRLNEQSTYFCQRLEAHLERICKLERDSGHITPTNCCDSLNKDPETAVAIENRWLKEELRRGYKAYLALEAELQKDPCHIFNVSRRSPAGSKIYKDPEERDRTDLVQPAVEFPPPVLEATDRAASNLETEKTASGYCVLQTGFRGHKLSEAGVSVNDGDDPYLGFPISREHNEILRPR